MRDAAREFDHLDTALDVALGVGDHLAVLGGEELREVVVVLRAKLQELEHHARAALRVRGRPARKRGLRIRDRLFHLGLAGERDLGLHLAGVWIEHIPGAARSAGNLLAANEMADLTHGNAPAAVWTLFWVNLKLACE